MTDHPKAILSHMPSRNGDGYSFGGEAVVTFADMSVVIGDTHIAKHIVDAINAYKPLPEPEGIF